MPDLFKREQIGLFLLFAPHLVSSGGGAEGGLRGLPWHIVSFTLC